MSCPQEVSHFSVPRMTKSEDHQHQLCWAWSWPSQGNPGPGLRSRMSVWAYDSLTVSFPSGRHMFVFHISAIFFFLNIFLFCCLLSLLSFWYSYYMDVGILNSVPHFSESVNVSLFLSVFFRLHNLYWSIFELFDSFFLPLQSSCWA